MWKQFTNSSLRYYSNVNQDKTVTLTIDGPSGLVTAHSLVVVLDRLDYIEDLYIDIVNTLEGNFHCCLTGSVDWL